jgi:hypothetical protein
MNPLRTRIASYPELSRLVFSFSSIDGPRERIVQIDSVYVSMVEQVSDHVTVWQHRVNDSSSPWSATLSKRGESINSDPKPSREAALADLAEKVATEIDLLDSDAPVEAAEMAADEDIDVFHVGVNLRIERTSRDQVWLAAYRGEDDDIIHWFTSDNGLKIRREVWNSDRTE